MIRQSGCGENIRANNGKERRAILYEERRQRVLRWMEKMELPQIIVTSTASVYYLTGLWVEPHERMLALLLDETGKLTLFGNVLFGLPEQAFFQTVLHRDGEDPVAELALALHSGVVGIDKFWPSYFLLKLMNHRKDVVPVEGSLPVDLARKNKDEAEREAMRHSSRMNDEVMGKAIAAIREGVRENELASLVNREYLVRGADCEGVQLVCFGANGTDPHHAADGTVIQAGDSVIFDLFTPIGRYWCDMTRTVFYKQVSERQKEVYELVKQASEAAIAKVRPGVLLSDLDRTARKVIEDGGFGPYFTHRLGHGYGLDCHEPPDVSGASHEALEAGMIFSIEPGIYLPGEFGVRIEDLVLVTETGCEVLNQYPKDLQVID